MFRAIVLTSASLLWLLTIVKSDIPSDQWGVTQIKYSPTNFLWMVNNFSLFNQETGKHFKSPVFTSQDNLYNWTLLLYPHGLSESGKDHVSLFLGYEGGAKSSVDASMEISILNASYAVVERINNSAKYEAGGSAYGSSHAIARARVLDENSGILRNGTLIVSVKSIVINEYYSVLGRCRSFNESSTAPQYSDDFIRYFNSDLFADATLVVQDGELKAHKVLLAGRSEYLESLLKVNSTIYMPDENLHVVRESLVWMYTGRLEPTTALWFKKDLLVFANKYGILRFRDYLAESVCESMDFDNAIEVLVFAEDNGAKRLKSIAVKFVAANARRFLDEPSFKKLQNTHPQLVMEILSAVVSAGNVGALGSYSVLPVRKSLVRSKMYGREDLTRAIRVLVFADDQKIRDAKIFAVDFIASNIDDFADFEELQEFRISQPRLMDEIRRMMN